VTVIEDAPVDEPEPMTRERLVLLMMTHDDAALAVDESAPLSLTEAEQEDWTWKFEPEIVMELPT
jgi:hypothetical protein